MLPGLPADIAELTYDLPDRLARRRLGWKLVVAPANAETLVSHRKPTISHPLMVVFTGEVDVARRSPNGAEAYASGRVKSG